MSLVLCCVMCCAGARADRWYRVFNPQPKNVITPWGDEEQGVAETGEAVDAAEEDEDMSDVKPVAR